MTMFESASLRQNLFTHAGLMTPLSSGLIILLAALPLRAADPNVDPTVGWARADDPAIELLPTEIRWPDELGAVWAKALQQPESDLRREAADSIRQAQQLGMPGLDALAEELMKVLDTPDEHSVIRTAAAKALVAIDARQAAPLLAKHTRRGPIALSLSVEPALARWDYKPARAIWLERLTDPATSSVHLQLTLQCIGQIQDMQAAADLKRLVTDRSVSASIRLAAAKALAEFPDGGLTELARRLAGDSSSRGRADRLVGVHLLVNQSSDDALELLDQYAAVPEPAVAAQAMQRLLAIAPERVVQRAASTIESPDARIRQLTVQALATEPSEASITTLVPVIGDSVPEIREDARRVLLAMSSNDELRRVVIEQTAVVLGGDSWRGLEQAILILTELDQEQVGERLLQLLHHPRHEVAVTAAWGLKTLAIPALVDTMFDEAKQFSAEAANVELEDVATATAVSAHLLEAMGIMQHEPAEEYLRTFIPKSSPHPEDVRAAAIWSLGHLWADADSLDSELVSQLEGRLDDWASVPPELDAVRRMSAVALGRMESETSLPVLRHWYTTNGPNDRLGASCGWAIQQITGETLPEPQPYTRQLHGWFLEPIGG